MTKELTNKVTKIYESPECSIVDIKAEGVLCASIEQLDEYTNEFEW